MPVPTFFKRKPKEQEDINEPRRPRTPPPIDELKRMAQLPAEMLEVVSHAHPHNQPEGQDAPVDKTVSAKRKSFGKRFVSIFKSSRAETSAQQNEQETAPKTPVLSSAYLRTNKKFLLENPEVAAQLKEARTDAEIRHILEKALDGKPQPQAADTGSRQNDAPSRMQKTSSTRYGPNNRRPENPTGKSRSHGEAMVNSQGQSFDPNAFTYYQNPPNRVVNNVSPRPTFAPLPTINDHKLLPPWSPHYEHNSEQQQPSRTMNDRPFENFRERDQAWSPPYVPPSRPRELPLPEEPAGGYGTLHNNTLLNTSEIPDRLQTSSTLAVVDEEVSTERRRELLQREPISRQNTVSQSNWLAYTNAVANRPYPSISSVIESMERTSEHRPLSQESSYSPRDLRGRYTFIGNLSASDDDAPSEFATISNSDMDALESSDATHANEQHGNQYSLDPHHIETGQEPLNSADQPEERRRPSLPAFSFPFPAPTTTSTVPHRSEDRNSLATTYAPPGDTTSKTHKRSSMQMRAAAHSLLAGPETALQPQQPQLDNSHEPVFEDGGEEVHDHLHESYL